MGPVFSGSIMVSMAETRRAEITNSSAGEAAAITQQGNPYIFRTLVHAVGRDAQGRGATSRTPSRRRRSPIIYVNDDFGKGGRDVIVPEFETLGVKVVADISTDPGQIDFSGPVLKAKQSNADALFVYPNEEESARLLRELRKQGYDKPIVGETTLANQKVIELAGDAANGIVAHVGLTADAPDPDRAGVRQEIRDRVQVQARSQCDEGLHGDVGGQGGYRQDRQNRHQGSRGRDPRRHASPPRITRAS